MNPGKISNVIRLLNNRYAKFGDYKADNSTILNHSLRSARFMQCILHDTPSAITSALLHNYGLVAKGIPAVLENHETVGVQALKRLGFPETVTKPISLQPLALRYLNTMHKNNGTKMTFEEVVKFQNESYYHEAITLRTVVDINRRDCPLLGNSILSFREYLEHVLRHT